MLWLDNQILINGNTLIFYYENDRVQGRRDIASASSACTSYPIRRGTTAYEA